MNAPTVRVGVVGLGKMGLSHLAIVNSQPETAVVACDQSKLLRDALQRYASATPVYKTYEAMLASADLDAVIIATPTRSHAAMVRQALERGLHVFCEKPLCLAWQDAEALADLAEEKGLVSQVGYHNRYVGPFREAKRVVDSGALGRITHATAEAYGPVVLRPAGSTWRSSASEGGGCLLDYAAHPINLINWYFGVPDRVSGSVVRPIFSQQTDDEVYSTLSYDSGVSVHVAANWSDESYRKMTTKVTVSGTRGRLTVDRTECRVYLREPSPQLTGYQKGWNIKYLTDFDLTVRYYLRGEEYSLQIEDFVAAVADRRSETVNSFRSAAATDITMARISADAARPPLAARAAG